MQRRTFPWLNVWVKPYWGLLSHIFQGQCSTETCQAFPQQPYNAPPHDSSTCPAAQTTPWIWLKSCNALLGESLICKMISSASKRVQYSIFSRLTAENWLSQLFFFPNFIFIIKVASCCYPSTGNCCLEWFWQASLPRDDKAKFAAGLLVLWILESDDPKNHQEKVCFAVFSTHTLLTSAINTHFLWRSQMLDGKVSKKGASLAEKKNNARQRR